jgi:hypothetical protein
MSEVGGLLALEEAGRRVAEGAPAAVDPGARGAATRLDADGALAALEDAAVALVALLERRALGTGEVSDEELAGGVTDALGARDRVEHRLLGAAEVLGHAPALGPAEESALLVFEALVRPALFRLVEVNELRRERVARLSPARRASFWWWQEGADVAPQAVAALPAVAHLCARFPAAAEQLATLVAAQRAWDDEGRARREARVISLGGWLRRAAESARAARPSAVAMAAAQADEEIALVDEARFQISWTPPDTLVIDLLADRAPGEVPAVRVGEAAPVRATAVEGAVERFAVRLDAAALAARRTTLILPLAEGPVELPLPPEPS